MNHSNHSYIVMFFIMLISGLLSTMNIWANSIDDIYLSINDVYMVFLMTGWMFFFMGIYSKEFYIFTLGLSIAFLSFLGIRYQVFVSEKQYLRGMIPHHSMAILMSKQMQKKENSIPGLLAGIIETQEKEIAFMKSRI